MDLDVTRAHATARQARPRRGGVALALVASMASCAPAHSSPGTHALVPRELGGRAVELRSPSGSTIRGWYARGRPGAGAVVLLHGIGASAADMLGRARFLAASGYSVLLVDFRGHGASDPARSTYGGRESGDARVAVEFLRAALPRERVAAIGISMGGAAALLGDAPLPVDALVLESVYPTIDAAIRNRMRAWLGPVGKALTRSVTQWLLPREGVTAADLRPIDRIGEQAAPVFVLAGAADPYTPPRETRALYERARAPKALWVIEGAAHVDLHAFAGAEYERRVGGFLERHLRTGTGWTRAPMDRGS
jgi:pimeloyl-ACP methyl ester carboxylesterase